MVPRFGTLVFSFLTIMLVQSASVWASGGDGPEDMFISRAMPDINLDQYETGSLGVILPTYPRIYLYPAWRAMLMGKEALQHEKRESGALERVCCKYISDWIDERDTKTPFAQWLQARSPVIPTPPRVRLRMDKRVSLNEWNSYRNCSDSSFSFAQVTLLSISKRPDATPARLRSWANAQDSVFEFCGYLEGEKTYSGNNIIDSPPVMPAPLPAQEAKFWRQLREYQIAAATFYAGNFAEARERFIAIGKDTSHPMHDWGDYLALRSAIRQVTLAEQKEPEQAKELLDMANRILRNPALAKTHPHVNASIRFIKARLTPEDRLQELSAMLNDWKQNPHMDDALGDWRMLANQYLDTPKKEVEVSMRAKYEFFDWMRSIQNCADGDKTETCVKEAWHALDKLRSSIKAKRSEARPWLVAVLISNQQLDAEVLAQAKKVTEDAPEYLTVQYLLVQRLHKNGQLDDARRLTDAQLTKSFASRSARNLFLEQRFSLATDLDDAARYLMRRITAYDNPDTKEVQSASEKTMEIADDGLRWLNFNLAISDLLKLAESQALPEKLRGRIAEAAWMRADLLGKRDLANLAAGVVGKLEPNLQKLSQNYLATVDEDERHHQLLVAGVSGLGMSPEFDSAWAHTYVPTKEEATASMWCHVGSPAHPEYMPPLSASTPQVSIDADTRDNEMKALTKIGTATSHLGRHMLAYAKKHPQNRDVPWLLHVVVKSTKGGCIDSDNSAISRSAYTLLHRKYGSTEWAAITPYWY